ncbi:MAG: hypothetical protein RLZZ272_92 [Actinomycetota bacterium]
MTSGRPRVHVVLATYEPDERFLAAQVASIRAQDGVELTAHVVDDGSSREAIARIRRVLGRDRRFELVALEHAGVAATFERGLALVPDGVDAVLLSDQDDVWHPDHATRVVALLDEGHLLAHTDAVVVDARGRTVAPSLFAHESRDVAASTPADLVIRNVVTGCTTALRPSLLAAALPFPEPFGSRPFLLHDLWLALCAASLGTVGVDPHPSVNYRQHRDNVIGAAPGIGRWRGWRQATGSWQRCRAIASAVRGVAAEGRLPRPGWGVRVWTGPLAELVTPVRLAAFALRRPGGRALARTLAAGALGAAALRLRALPGRLAVDLGRKARKALAVLVHVATAPRVAANALVRSAGLTDDGPLRSIEPVPYGPQCRPLRAVLHQRAGRVVNVLIPGVSPSGVFGGVATAVTIAVRLAEAGERVRLVLTDYGQTLSEARIRALVLRHVATTPEALGRIAVTNAIRDDRVLDLGPGDVFLATAWWTAFRAANTIAAEPRLVERRVHYLVQDHEPLFYPASDRQLDAQRSYELPALHLVNSAPLAEHLRTEVGLVIDPALVFAPVVAVPRAPLRAMPAPGEPLRVLVYGRPGVGRNLFDTALRGLALWIAERRSAGGALDPELVTIGERLPVRYEVAGVPVRDLGVLAWGEYLGLLARSHVGVSLMTSPHPSYPPLEMASSGMVVVSNRWGPKDLGSVTRRIVSCDPDPVSLSRALGRAEARLAAGGDPPIRLERLGVDLDAVVAAYRGHLEAPPRGRRRR